MKNVLVMQMYRFGDVLQSTPAINAIRRNHPDARIHVMVRKALADVLRGNPDVDEIVEWDVDAICAAASAGDDHLKTSVDKLRDFIVPLKEKKFEAVYNLSNDMPCAMVAYLLQAPEISGLVFCRDRRYRVRNEWLRYLFLASEVRYLNSLNLVDIFAEACGGTATPALRIAVREEDQQRADAIIFGNTSAPRPPIAVQIGAGKDHKRWAPELFVQLGNRLMSKGHDLFFLGSHAERDQVKEVCRRLAPSGRKAANLAGETSFGRLAALIKKCRLLVSNDTAAVHVAAAVQTPSVVLTFGAANALETGPYGEGHFILEPDTACFPCDGSSLCPNLPCRDNLTLDVVLGAVECAMSNGKNVPSALKGNGVILHVSQRMPDGLLGLQPLTKPTLGIRDLLRAMTRTYFLTTVLPNARRASSPRWRPWLVEFFDWYEISERSDILRKALSAASDFESIHKLAYFGVQSAASLLMYGAFVSRDVKERLASSMAALEDRILAAEENQVLRYLVTDFRHGLRDMENLPLRESAMAHRWYYQRLANACLFMTGTLHEFTQAMVARKGDYPVRRGT